MSKTSRYRRNKNKRTWRNQNRQHGGKPVEESSSNSDASSEQKNEEEKPKGNIITRAVDSLSKAATSASATMGDFLTKAQTKGKEGTSDNSSAPEEETKEKEKDENKQGSFFSLPSFISGSPSAENNSIKDDIKSLIERLDKEKDQLIHNREENEEAIRNLVMAIMKALKALEMSNQDIQDKLKSIKAEQAAIGSSEDTAASADSSSASASSDASSKDSSDGMFNFNAFTPNQDNTAAPQLFGNSVPAAAPTDAFGSPPAFSPELASPPLSPEPASPAFSPEPAAAPLELASPLNRLQPHLNLHPPLNLLQSHNKKRPPTKYHPSDRPPPSSPQAEAKSAKLGEDVRGVPHVAKRISVRGASRRVGYRHHVVYDGFF